MSFHVEFTARAERDVDTILAWLGQKSPQGAEAWFSRLNEVLQQLNETANHCDFAPENEDHDEEIRHVVFKTLRGKKYRALFIIREHHVFVLHVRGPGQDLMAPEDVQFP